MVRAVGVLRGKVPRETLRMHRFLELANSGSDPLIDEYEPVCELCRSSNGDDSVRCGLCCLNWHSSCEERLIDAGTGIQEDALQEVAATAGAPIGELIRPLARSRLVAAHVDRICTSCAWLVDRAGALVD